MLTEASLFIGSSALLGVFTQMTVTNNYQTLTLLKTLSEFAQLSVSFTMGSTRTSGLAGLDKHRPRDGDCLQWQVLAAYDSAAAKKRRPVNLGQLDRLFVLL